MKRIRLATLCVLILGFLLSACKPDTSLKNTNWRLVNLGGQPALADVDVTLNLEDGQLGGSDGCNSYGGSYTSKGSEFTVGTDIVSTMMYCTDTINIQSVAYYTALSQVASFKLKDQTLSLLNTNGTVLMDFSRAE
jgi:heat shock protein HslJ